MKKHIFLTILLLSVSFNIKAQIPVGNFTVNGKTFVGFINPNLDFDGTVVEHQYPAIGRCNSGCLEVIDKLNRAGHEIVLNTMRVEFGNGTLTDALEFLNHSLTNLNNNAQIYSFKHTDHKYDPTIWNWDLHFKTERIFIDDVCEGIPLKAGLTSSRKMVDWDKLDLEFKAHGLYV